ncbi:MAG: hypothetical protein Q8Q95_04200 [bacterium]|nr:hypothetical protein [bacterium]
MNEKINKLDRKEKEQLYIKKMTELQTRWGNPIDDDWNLSEWTDKELDKGLADTIGQLRFEKSVSFLKKLFLYPIYIFIVLGIIGLLVFGVKQLN